MIVVVAAALFWTAAASTSTVSARSRDVLATAQCESRCYRDPKHSKPVWSSTLSGHGDFVSYECIEDECHKCVNATLVVPTKIEDCQAFCGRLGASSCHQSCDCVYRITQVEGMQELSEGVARPLPPTVVCQDISEKKNVWTHRGKKNGNTSRATLVDVHVVIANGLEWNGSDQNVSDWELLGKSRSAFLKVPHLKPSTWYQVRTRAVAPDGVLATSAISEWFQTLPENATLVPPRSIQFKETSPVGRHLSTTFVWEPPLENFCFYKLFWFHDNDEKVRGKNLFLPFTGSIVTIERLSFATNYTLQMMTTSGDGKTESKKLKFHFVTSSCLQTFGSNFSLCGPGPPSSLVCHKVDAMDLSSKDKATVLLSWKPPRSTFKSNQILFYQITFSRVISFYNFLPFVFQRNVSGNVTELTIDNVDKNSDYVASVAAVSLGGVGEPVTVFFNLPASDDKSRQNGGASLVIMFAVLPAALLLIVVFVCVLVFKWHYRRRSSKLLRNRYFESLEQCEPLETYDSMGPLDTRPSKGDYAFEVEFDKLLLSDILGQGAFGLVRKAQMRCNKSWKLWEDVAVKTMHPNYSDQDERYFLEEIEMMMNVGHHPHLVSLLAYCVSKPNLCLVVEYCPFGDLQTYLRKYRNKEVMLMLNEAKSRNDRKSLNDSGIVDQHLFLHEPNGETSEMSQSGESSGSEGAKERRQRKRSRGVSEFSNYESDNDGFREEDLKLTLNNLLSFARQVCLGMEYLSQNKLVHRDLAARNVLVYDRKLVKISDFGFMRDIYENNVYRKKTDGKLPIKWMAYESIFDQVYTSKSDVWSFGILLYEIFTLGNTPYPGISNMQLLGLLKKNYRMEKPPNCDDVLYNLMTTCWHNCAASRPTFTELRRQLESIMENSLNYLTLDLSMDEEKFYRLLEKGKSTQSHASSSERNSDVIDDDPIRPEVGVA